DSGGRGAGAWDFSVETLLPQRHISRDEIIPHQRTSRTAMKLPKLRIAWSVVCGAAAVFLLVLWVRSYWHYDWLGGLSVTPVHPSPGTGQQFVTTGGCLFESADGAVVVIFRCNIEESLSNLRSFGTSSAGPGGRVTGNDNESARNGFRFRPYPDGTFRAS